MNFRKLTEKEVYALPRNQFVYLTDMYHLTLDGNVPPKLVHPNRTPVITGNAIIKGDDGMMFPERRRRHPDLHQAQARPDAVPLPGGT